jgi:hypothetical protein
MTIRSKQWYTKTSRLPNSLRTSPSVVSLCSRLDNKIIGQTTGGFKMSNIFGLGEIRSGELDERLEWLTASRKSAPPVALVNHM